MRFILSAATFTFLFPLLGVAQSTGIKPNSLAPYVNSPALVVERMLELAQLKPGETLFDLGSGDGRVLIAAASRFNVKAVGVELSERLVKKSQDRIQQEGLSDRASVIHDNLLNADISSADVVILYLLRDANDMIRPKLEASLRPGTRVVSHDYEIRGWKPTRVEEAEAFKRKHKIYVYEMPPQKQ